MATHPQLLRKKTQMEALGVHYEAYISVVAMPVATRLHDSKGKGVLLEEAHADRGW